MNELGSDIAGRQFGLQEDAPLLRQAMERLRFHRRSDLLFPFLCGASTISYGEVLVLEYLIDLYSNINAIVHILVV